MDELDKLIDILNTEEKNELMHEMYQTAKDMLDRRWHNIDEEDMLSYIKAYCIYLYLNMDDERQKGLYLLAIEMNFAFIGIFSAFVDKMNAIKARMSDLKDKNVLESLKLLYKYINDPKYEELSKSNFEIADMIKDYHGYFTIDEIKSGKYLYDKNNPLGYQLTGREIEIIDRTKKYYQLNQLAHMLYDEEGIYHYYCDKNIYSNEEILKRFIVDTNKENPQYEIVFDDGIILDYVMGNIWIKPYKFNHVLTYTKLFYVKNYDSMRDYYYSILHIKPETLPKTIKKQMIMSSFMNVIKMFYALEDVYSQKMINDSKEDFVKIKRIVKDYDL